MTTTPKGITTNLLPQLLELLAASKSLMAQVDRKRYNIRKDFDFFLADAAMSGAIARTEIACAAPATGTEIGDGTASDLEQLSDFWHIGSAIETQEIRDSNGLLITSAQIIRCKIERDNLLQSVRDLLSEATDEQREEYDAFRFAAMIVTDIDRHEDGL